MSILFTLLVSCGLSFSDEPTPQTSVTDKFFERLDKNSDGKLTLAEAPEQGKMLVEFLLRQSGKKVSDQLEREEFMKLAHRHVENSPEDRAVAAAVGVGDVRPAPTNCPACAMGLTLAEMFLAGDHRHRSCR